MMYSYKNQYPTILPDRIRLSNGMTRTDKTTFSADEIADAGYVLAAPYPDNTNEFQKVEWTGTDWIVVGMSDDEYESAKSEMWVKIRTLRNSMLSMLDWRVARVQSQIRLGIPTTDSLLQLDEYAQALRDITTQTDPFNIEWPLESKNSV